jgi:hypothetical protein
MVEKCKSALTRARSLEGEKHNGLKGELREILVNDLFAPVLPPNVKTGTGKLVSSEGESSPQIDIIFYAPGILPPVLFDTRTGYFPTESALYVIEVKSKLTSAALRSAIRNAHATRSLPLLPTEHWEPTPDGHHPVRCVRAPTPRAVNALFAFDSDLSGETATELDRYLRYDGTPAIHPAIQVLCVVGKGYWYLSGTGWKHVPADPEIGEVMSFLAGTSNTLPQLMIAKGRPRFGNYLTTEIHEPKLVRSL